MNEHIFIDGNPTTAVVSGLKNASIFSYYENEELAVSSFVLGDSDKEDIRQNVIKEVIEFYNKNSKVFRDFEAKHGVNVWFLEHMRLNFAIIEQRQNELIKRNFLQVHPDGKIIKVAKPSELTTKIKKAFKELLILFRLGLGKLPELNGVLLLHNEELGGFSVSELFGQLTHRYKVFKIRSLFNLKQKLPQFTNVKSFPNSDQLVLRSIFRCSFWIRLRAFLVDFSKVVNTVIINSQATTSQQVVNHLKSKKGYFSLLFLRYYSFDWFFKNNHVTGVILSDENSPQQKTIQYAARKNNVKLYGVQHGAIYNYHFAYTYGKYLYKPILPDLTFTWGEYYTEVLTTFGGYRTDQVETVGSLRKKPVTTQNKDGISGKKTVLYATQPIPDEGLRKKQLKDVFRCFSRLESTHQIVIRPHPKESDDEYFTKIANTVGLKTLKIERNTKIEEHFERADLLITAYSTVGAEFIEHYKPLIVLDYLNEDKAGYFREKVAFKATSQQQLYELLTKKDLEIDVVAFKKFITRFFFASDGKAASRVYSKIESIEKNN